MTAILALSALAVLAAWIVKTRRNSRIDLTIETRNADGSSRTVAYKKEISSETSEADVLKEMAALLRVPL